MEQPFRSFVEECDNLQVGDCPLPLYSNVFAHRSALRQGLQLLADVSSFWAFSHSFLTRFRDEFIKLPSFSFPVMSDVDPKDVDVDDVSLCTALNNRRD